MLSKKSIYFLSIGLMFAWMGTSFFWMKQFKTVGLCIWLIGLITLTVFASIAKKQAGHGEQA